MPWSITCYGVLNAHQSFHFISDNFIGVKCQKNIRESDLNTVDISWAVLQYCQYHWITKYNCILCYAHYIMILWLTHILYHCKYSMVYGKPFTMIVDSLNALNSSGNPLKLQTFELVSSKFRSVLRFYKKQIRRIFNIFKTNILKWCRPI